MQNNSIETNLSILLYPLCCFLSCSTPQGFEYKGLNNVKVKNLGFEYVDLSLNLVCYNPNNFRLDLKQVDCEVYIDNRYLGKYTLDTLMQIPKKQNFELPLKCVFQWVVFSKMPFHFS